MAVESHDDESVRFTLAYEQSKLVACTTNSLTINHFLDVIRMSRAHNTWVSYAHDLKIFFQIIPKPPEHVNRADCVAFMKHQQEAGLSTPTINRRLAALSSLFKELQLMGIVELNPVQPAKASSRPRQRSHSLYHPHRKRLPTTIRQEDLQTFFATLPTWRDRTLILLMWISCLRVGEVVSIRYADIECSRRSVEISQTKNGQPRLVFMDSQTFAALNRYLDDERGDLFPEVSEIFVAFKGKARGQALTVNAVQKMVSYYAARCGLPHLHPHLFRHTGITQLTRQKMSEPALRQLVGHRHPDSLLPYLHLGDDFVETEFERAQTALDATNWLTGGEE